MSMFDRLEDTLRRYEDVTAELGNPDIVTDQDKFRKYMKEQSNLAPIVEAYTEYKASKQNIEDSLQMISEESDEELLEMAREELADSKKKVEELEKKLKILLLPKDPNDDKDIVVESELVQVEKKQHFLPQNFSVCTHTMQILRAGR